MFNTTKFSNLFPKTVVSIYVPTSNAKKIQLVFEQGQNDTSVWFCHGFS